MFTNCPWTIKACSPRTMMGWGVGEMQNTTDSPVTLPIRPWHYRGQYESVWGCVWVNIGRSWSGLSCQGSKNGEHRRREWRTRTEERGLGEHFHEQPINNLSKPSKATFWSTLAYHLVLLRPADYWQRSPRTCQSQHVHLCPKHTLTIIATIFPKALQTIHGEVIQASRPSPLQQGCLDKSSLGQGKHGAKNSHLNQLVVWMQTDLFQRLEVSRSCPDWPICAWNHGTSRKKRFWFESVKDNLLSIELSILGQPNNESTFDNIICSDLLATNRVSMRIYLQMILQWIDFD